MVEEAAAGQLSTVACESVVLSPCNAHALPLSSALPLACVGRGVCVQLEAAGVWAGVGAGCDASVHITTPWL